MNISLRKSLWIPACLILCSSPLRANVHEAELENSLPMESSFDGLEEEITERIKTVVSIVEPRYNSTVKSYLRTYLEANPARTEAMLGRIDYYFPMFEKLLAQHGMPEELKYLAIVESALNPHATSRVGAVGLWQFMRPTAKEMGLEMNKYIDERRDPEKSTMAAIRYLDKLHKRFGDWALAMAAYNAGPGRVSYAIRKAGSEDFWKVMHYLPRETRAYVPGFIAASYLVNYYQEHKLQPSYLGLDFYDTEWLRVHRAIDFTEIQHITGVHTDIIRQLNPSFLRNYIPASTLGHNILLPRYAITAFAGFLDLPDAGETGHSPAFLEMLPGNALQYENRPVVDWYKVQRGDNLYKIGQRKGCTVDELMEWNRLKDSDIAIGQSLKVIRMERVLVGPPLRKSFITEALVKPIAPVQASVKFSLPQIPHESIMHEKQGIRGRYLRLERRQSLLSMLRQNDVPVDFAMTGKREVTTGTVFQLD